MNYYLYIDDVRNFNSIFKTEEELWHPIILRSYQEALDFLINCYNCKNDVIFLDLDHDLGYDSEGKEKTGLDICELIVNSYPNSIYGFHIHSMNPVGAKRMRDFLTDYGYEEY